MTQLGKKDPPYTLMVRCLVCQGKGLRFAEQAELSAVCQVCDGYGYVSSSMSPDELKEAERAHGVRLAKGELKLNL